LDPLTFLNCWSLFLTFICSPCKTFPTKTQVVLIIYIKKKWLHFDQLDTKDIPFVSQKQL
jgi:hypothetical protein